MKNPQQKKISKHLNLQDLKDLAHISNITWTKEQQISHSIEEVGEYLTALSHYRRGRIKKSALIEEMADVVIMMFAVADIHGMAEFDKQLARKFKTTAKRIVQHQRENQKLLHGSK